MNDKNQWMPVFSDPPELGQWCWICDDGVVQREAWQLDATDDGDSMLYFWYRPDPDGEVMPLRDTQTWMPLPEPPQ